MAFQKGIIKLKGAIGDLTFYKTRNNGFQVREKGGIDASRIAGDPGFKRTRENMSEFGRAQKATKLMKKAFLGITVNGADSSMHNRLSKAMVQVVKNDSINNRGERMVLDAETELLKGFEFNAKAQLAGTVLVPYLGTIDRASGQSTIAMPSFVPREFIFAPEGTTHFKFKSALTMIDFETEASEINRYEGELMAYDNNPTPPLNIQCTLSGAHTKPLFLALGIDFYQRVNGRDYQLNNGARNGLSIIEVSGV